MTVVLGFVNPVFPKIAFFPERTKPIRPNGIENRAFRKKCPSDSVCPGPFSSFQPLPAAVCRCLSLSAAVCRCLPRPAPSVAVCRCLPRPPLSGPVRPRPLLSGPVRCCPPLPAAVRRCPPLSAASGPVRRTPRRPVPPPSLSLPRAGHGLPAREIPGRKNICEMIFNLFCISKTFSYLCAPAKCGKRITIS